ncbi:MAG: error-prone DNA polymerase [Burkholderiales bacterium]|nr:error-prone DNA polymerase [Burkholderiales bacterium]
MACSNARLDAAPDYAELHCLSNFSFLRGASHPEELVETAHALGYRALALTDECSLAGVVRAHLAAEEKNLPLIIGAEFALAWGQTLPFASSRQKARSDPVTPRIVVLATDREGYGNLSATITLARRRSGKGEYHLTPADLVGRLAQCVVILLPDRALVRQADDDADAERILHAQLAWLKQHFDGAAWLGVEFACEAGDRAHLARLQALGRRFDLPCVACGDVHMHARSRRALQDTLTAIRSKCTLAEAGYRLFPNGERHLRTRERLARLYPPELLAETLKIAERCSFSLASLRYEYPEEVVDAGETPTSQLRKLTAQGFELRYRVPLAATPARSSPPENIAKVRAQVEQELALIAELRYESYFLTVHDIVRYARSQEILCQGRGSAANSAVCYCLHITEVDPARMNVLFERFISRERKEPPDIDVDFEHQRREEVMQYIYAKYGRDRAALAATLITYQPKSAIRDVGKALGMELAQVDRLAKSLAWWDRRAALVARIRDAGFDPESPILQRLIALVDTLIGFPRHLSQHVGGFVISRGPLDRMVPIENAAMAERTVIQWDKDDLDALGLLKVDCLALGMLSAIRRALDLVSQRRGQAFRMQDVPAEDAAVYAMIGKADTIGVFQIESRAQMSMLPRLKPRTFYDLVIEVAIVRPGPIQGGMVHPYLRRREKKEPITYPSEAIKAVLERTLGVPIFQEQVMQLAVVAAGFTPGEADQLRRSMAAWRRKGGLEHFEQRLIEGMARNGYSEAFARQIYQQILGFGEYGFPESHSASFALLAYVSSWLKCHEPAAFTCALLNSQPMGFYPPSQLVQDARRHGVEVRPVDAMVSAWDCTLEDAEESVGIVSEGMGTVPQGQSPAPSPGPPALRLGLCMVSGLSQAAAERIVAARRQYPRTVDELARAARLDRGELDRLARAGALETLAGHRRHALWQTAGIERRPPLFADLPVRESAVSLAAPTEAQDIVADYRSLGLTLRRHPLALLRPSLERRRMASAAALLKLPHGRLAQVAGIVTCRQRPGTASGVVFLTLEDETGYANIVVWRSLLERQRQEVLSARLLGVRGTIEREGEVVHLVAARLYDLSALLGELPTGSRDFH